MLGSSWITIISIFISACQVGNYNSVSSESKMDTNDKHLVSAICYEGGSVTFDKEYAEYGESILMTVEPNQGYSILRVMDDDCTVSLKAEKYYRFNFTDTTDIKVWFTRDEDESIDYNYIHYVKEENVPVLDGKIDPVWNNVPTLTLERINETNGTYIEDANAWVKILWTEKGFYYLANVHDSSLVAMDKVNFWVSERYLEPHYDAGFTIIKVPYSNLASDGNYSICLDITGNNVHYSGINIENYWDQNSTVKITDYGYIAELFVPCLSETSLYEGMEIGFDVSVDYYSNPNSTSVDSDRDAYSFWGGIGHYWSDISGLVKMTLIK